MANPLLKSLTLANLLSFGPTPVPIPLGQLNVLIGPNGSGKSNLVETLSLLQAAPRDIATVIREGGGVRDWLWKGGSGETVATIECTVGYPKEQVPLRYRLSFTEVAQHAELTDERLEKETPLTGYPKPFFYFGYEAGRPMLSVAGGDHRELHREDVNPQQSILSQRKDPDQYPEITWLGEQFASIRIYRNWSFGRFTPPRIPQPPDLPNIHLDEEARNLGLVLNRLRRNPKVKQRLIEQLRDLYEGLEDVDVSIEGGTVQVLIQESRWSIPATRLSDGTLRWLVLLSILLNPEPPPLVCIEEPELGLHPDLLPRVATLLTDASDRMQLVVTTHSDVLVDALTATPEAVVVCERAKGMTTMHRLDRGDLKAWLERYSLGQLWRKGEIGGNRW
jgi:predicted ATPase